MTTTMLNLFTVIGYYESDGQVFCDNVKAEDAHDAMQISAASARGTSGNLIILGAVDGFHTMTCACEESGSMAAADDLLASEEG